jgi:hypothetical protein
MLAVRRPAAARGISGGHDPRPRRGQRDPGLGVGDRGAGQLAGAGQPRWTMRRSGFAVPCIPERVITTIGSLRLGWLGGCARRCLIGQTTSERYYCTDAKCQACKAGHAGADCRNHHPWIRCGATQSRDQRLVRLHGFDRSPQRRRRNRRRRRARTRALGCGQCLGDRDRWPRQPGDVRKWSRCRGWAYRLGDRDHHWIRIWIPVRSRGGREVRG